MPRVILDAGHGGSDVGDYYENRREKDDNLRLTLRVGEILRQSGVDVQYTRTEDVYLSQLERTQLANQFGGDLLVSFHRLMGRNLTNIPGLAFFVKMNDPLGREAAENIGNQLAESGYQTSGIIIRSELPLLSATEMPALMVAIGFMESESENWHLDENFDTIAQEIARGILMTLSEENRSDENAQDSNPTANELSNRCRYYIIVGPFHNYEAILLYRNHIKVLGYPAVIMEEKHKYFLWAGNFSNLDEAAVLENVFHQCGQCTKIISY